MLEIFKITISQDQYSPERKQKLVKIRRIFGKVGFLILELTNIKNIENKLKLPHNLFYARRELDKAKTGLLKLRAHHRRSNKVCSDTVLQHIPYTYLASHQD